MYNTLETHVMVYQEQLNDRLRKIQHQRLLQAAGLYNGVSLNLYRQSISWLGTQLVKWGSALQSLAVASPAEHVPVNR
ncbi:MAG: hypothetical protein JXM69_01930 [Anaerolineae bacterium]|nr:hypothetical protein [Anaerolineae bacterium]